VPRHLHRHALRDARADEAADGDPPEVVRDAAGTARRRAGVLPGPIKLSSAKLMVRREGATEVVYPPDELTKPLVASMDSYLLGDAMRHLETMMENYVEEHRAEFEAWLYSLPHAGPNDPEVVETLIWPLKLEVWFELRKGWRRRVGPA